MKAYKIRVYGRIQRVGYRRYILDLAQEYKLAGYIENLKDGSVEIFIQGDEETLNKFLEKARTPQYPAIVRWFKIEETKPDPEIKYFEIKYGPLAEELQEGFGAMQAIFMDYWREFRDYRQEFREFAKRTDENFKILMEKYGEISNKLTEILNILVKESRETREILLENIKLLREAIEKLSK